MFPVLGFSKMVPETSLALADAQRARHSQSLAVVASCFHLARNEPASRRSIARRAWTSASSLRSRHRLVCSPPRELLIVRGAPKRREPPIPRTSRPSSSRPPQSQEAASTKPPVLPMHPGRTGSQSCRLEHRLKQDGQGPELSPERRLIFTGISAATSAPSRKNHAAGILSELLHEIRLVQTDRCRRPLGKPTSPSVALQTGSRPWRNRST